MLYMHSTAAMRGMQDNMPERAQPSLGRPGLREDFPGLPLPAWTVPALLQRWIQSRPLQGSGEASGVHAEHACALNTLETVTAGGQNQP